MLMSEIRDTSLVFIDSMKQVISSRYHDTQASLKERTLDSQRRAIHPHGCRQISPKRIDQDLVLVKFQHDIR